ncbi:nitroreductase family protein [uncultured Clostridium sp.]|uniref:nitroreductase family protein n=1 Tax=uncultured Clostridium sp. TaxID=59620 RepID=UPI0025DE3EB0|nr:nitroreductase family protein [uncultured Clostridium sp.]
MKEKNSLIEVMNSRHSIRSYDSTYEIPREKIIEMLQEAATAPSSHNLQSWRFIIIDDEEEKKALRKIAWNQEQVETASATIAIIGDVHAYEKAKDIASKSISEGLMTEEIGKNYVDTVMKLYPNVPEETLKNLCYIDGGLIAMQFMLIAKANDFDTVCMGGFDSAAFSKYYNLPNNYIPLVLISVGKANKEPHTSTRLNVEDLLLNK